MKKRILIAMIASLGMIMPQMSPPMTTVVQAADASVAYAQRKAYADEQIKKYLGENINDSMTQLEKLDVITKYAASFDYSYYYQSYVDMVYFKGGDCWASSNLIQHMCELVGIKSHIRIAMNDPGAGSGHRNVAAQIDGKTYVAEAGYAEDAPRYYEVTELPDGYSVRTDYDLKTADAYQYDGEDKDLVIPSKIYKYNTLYTVTSVGGYTFDGIGDIVSIKIPDTVKEINAWGFSIAPKLQNIQIPATVEKIGDHPFIEDYSLKSIGVDEDNPNYTSVDGVLYTKDMKTIVSYPAGKEDKSFSIPSSVTTIASGAFGNMRHTSEIIVPASVKKIESRAFTGLYENNPTIRFLGDLPENDGTMLFNCTDPLIIYPTGNTTFPTEYKKQYGKWQEGSYVYVKSEQDLIDEENAKKAAEEAKRKAEEEEARRKAAEEEKRKAEEEARCKAEEEARRKAEEEEAERQAAEEEARKKEEEEYRKFIEEQGDDDDNSGCDFKVRGDVINDWYYVVDYYGGGDDYDDSDDGDSKEEVIIDGKSRVGTKFQKKGLLYKVTSTGKAKVIRCQTNASNVTIPKVVSNGSETFKVVSIGKKSFYGKKKLKKVTIGKNVLKIGKNAFGRTPKLKKIVLKSKVLKSKRQLKKAGNGKVRILKK